MNGEPSVCDPRSKTFTTLGWVMRATALASRSKRCFSSGSSAMAATITLRATSRSRMVSWARYTIPIAPLPSGLTMSYLPMRPESSLIGPDGAEGLDSGSLIARGTTPLRPWN